MASRKKGRLSKYCRIFQWVETQDSALAGAIRDLCMEGQLWPRRGRGVTFLYPKEKAYREEIIAKTYSDEAEQAIRMLEALILPVHVATPADFRGDIGSKLGVKLEVESISGGKIMLQGGVQLAAAPSFEPLRRDNIAVWLLEAGRAPLDGAEWRPSRSPPKPKRTVRGGSSRRLMLADRTMQAFIGCMDKPPDFCTAYHPYLANVVSLLNFLDKRHPDLLQKVRPVLDRDPIVTFFLLIEPHRQSAPYLLDDSVLFGGPLAWNETMFYTNAVEEYQSFFVQPGNPSRLDIPKIFSEPHKVREAVNALREQIVPLLNRKDGPQAVKKAYDDFVRTNLLGEFGPIVPEQTLQDFKSDKQRWNDEFRFTLHVRLEDALNEPIPSPTAFEAIISDVRQYFPGNNYTEEAKMTSLSLYEPSGDVSGPWDLWDLFISFFNSTAFLYFPVPERLLDDAGPITRLHDQRPGFIYNHELAAHKKLKTVTGMVVSGPSLLLRRQLDPHYGQQISPAEVGAPSKPESSKAEP